MNSFQCSNTLTATSAYRLPGESVDWKVFFTNGPNGLWPHPMQASATTTISVENGSDCLVDKKLGIVYKIEPLYIADFEAYGTTPIWKPVTAELLAKLEWHTVSEAEAKHCGCPEDSWIQVCFDTETEDHPLALVFQWHASK